MRKHLSAIKGGQLARAASPAGIVSLIISDVVGDRLDTIASGPTYPDSTTYSDALSVIERYELKEKVPPGIPAHLTKSVSISRVSPERCVRREGRSQGPPCCFLEGKPQ
ncbi:glycerate-2-kinase family protein [Dehalococcoidia bacterium]|nr:glycerate-2-kinase family protein [Dehalococcoidia bacterium]MCL0064362.1 glycerate-2-kinase family protein [Dehalococcoidia bacterium]